MMSPITTHILDTSAGRPAANVAVRLEFGDGDGGWQPVAAGTTDGDGRISDLLPPGTAFAAGLYRLTFEVGSYFQDSGVKSFYRQVPIVFAIEDPAQHYHVPLLLSPFGYSTYRGS